MDDLDKHRWERLLRWLRDDHGMDVSAAGFHVEAREVQGAGRGLFASGDCPPSTTLFKVPSTALLNPKTAASLYPQLRRQKLSGVQLVSLHLFLHKPSGDDDSTDPSFGPYISTLPRDFSSHPLQWMVKRDIQFEDPWEYLMLETLPPGVKRKLDALHQRFWEDWRAVSRVVVEFPAIRTLSNQADVTRTSSFAENSDQIMNYVWAWLNVNTRCIFYRLRSTLADSGNFTLCPVLDFANHNYGRTHIFPVIDSEIWGVVAKKTPKHYLFLGPSKDAISQGQELYLQYGNHCNAFLFSEYGFVNTIRADDIASGSYAGEVDVQELVEILFAENARVSQLKPILESEGYWGDWTLHGAPTPAHPSFRLIAALRLLHVVDDKTGGPISEALVDAWRNVLLGVQDQISSTNEDLWRRTLVKLCERIIKRGRENITSLSAVPWGGFAPLWQEWMMENVRTLWAEEVEVATAVVASVRAGVEF